MTRVLIAFIVVLLVPLFVATWRTSLLGLVAPGLPDGLDRATGTPRRSILRQRGSRCSISSWCAAFAAPLALYAVLRARKVAAAQRRHRRRTSSRGRSRSALVARRLPLRRRPRPAGGRAADARRGRGLCAAARVARALDADRARSARWSARCGSRTPSRCSSSAAPRTRGALGIRVGHDRSSSLVSVGFYRWYLRHAAARRRRPTPSRTRRRRRYEPRVPRPLAPALVAPGIGSRAARACAPLALLGVAARARRRSAIVVARHRERDRADRRRLPAHRRDRAAVPRRSSTSIFLGIAVYVWNRARTTPELRDAVARFARLSLVFLRRGERGRARRTILLASWIALEATTLAAAPLDRSRTASPRRGVRRGATSSSRRSGSPRARSGSSCLARGLEASGHAPTFFLDELPQPVGGPAEPVATPRPRARACSASARSSGSRRCTAGCPRPTTRRRPPVTALLAPCSSTARSSCCSACVQVFRAGDAGARHRRAARRSGSLSMAVSTVSIIATRNFKRLHRLRLDQPRRRHRDRARRSARRRRTACCSTWSATPSSRRSSSSPPARSRRTTAPRTRARSPGSSRTCRTAASS